VYYYHPPSYPSLRPAPASPAVTRTRLSLSSPRYRALALVVKARTPLVTRCSPVWAVLVRPVDGPG
jgi:hypothetical protein